MLDNYIKLRNEWKQSSGMRAAGGVYALQGFDYQFGVFLLKLLEKWAKAYQNKNTIPSPATSIESISDIVDLSADGLLYVTQVKLNTPTNNNKLFEIFEEFWEIYNLARRVIPGNEGDLRFVICTSNAPQPDIQKNYEKWIKKTAKPQLLASHLGSIISTKRVPEPHDRILSLLANELYDTRPVDHLYNWIGRLLAASSKGAFDSAIEDIWNNLIEIVNNVTIPKNPIYVWRDIDCPPSQITSGRVLTGEQPLPRNLREGYFSPRPDVYNDLAEKFSQWTAAQRRAGDCSLRLPVFWISGRSGSGKSVALLHLLSSIHSEENIHIFWIGQRVNLLPEAIKWAILLREQGREAIIAVDDPYAPATQDDDKIWKDALASLESMRCSGEVAGLPVLVCCGPTEHAEKLEHTHPDEVIVHRVPLRAEQQSDLDELRIWYKQRTGAEAPDVGDENVLLVQLFFQWRSKATLPEFAARFHKRIKEADPKGKLIDIFSQVLAANRLYLGYPQVAFDKNLSPPLRDSVAQLKDEHHIADMSMGRDGVWLAHPHLSNAIYECWYPSSSTVHTREAHLVTLINDALSYGETPREKTAPLWAVSRSVSANAEDEPVVGRLDPRTITRIVPHIFQQRLDASGRQLLTLELPVWIQIRASFPTISLNPDPLDLAINKIQSDNTSDTGLRLTCHKLLQFQASMSTVQAAIFIGNLTALLKATINTWFEWPHVAVDAYKRTVDKTIETLLVEWIRANDKKHIAHGILLDLLHAGIQGGVIDEVASTVLVKQSDDSMLWSDIAKQIVIRRRSDSAVQCVREWAALHRKEFRAGFLLAEMVRQHIPDAINLAREWAQICHKEPSANWVLEVLCDKSDPNPMLRDWCIAWLTLDHSQSNPGFLAEKLVRVYPADTVVRQYIHQWLRQGLASRPAWFYVWDAAYTVAPSDSGLSALGIEALRSVWPENRFWIPSWQKLFYENRYNKQLIDIGFHWLRKLPKNRQVWISAWNMLWHATGGTIELYEIGLEWLDVNMRSKVWAGLWGRFWKLYHGDDRLVAVAKKWLSHNLWQWNVWFAVWDEIWKIDKEDDEVNRLAHAWLAKIRLDLPSWSGVWERVWSYDGPDDELRVLGLRWLQNTQYDHGSWQRIWAALWNDKIGDNVLQSMGQEWLDAVSMTDGSWPKMWKDLWPLDKANSILIKRGLEWISKVGNFNHGDWQHNWKELVLARKEDDSLIQLGTKWLRVTPAYNNYWVDVWMFLATRTQVTSSMIDMARKWLQQTLPSRNKWPNLWIKIKEQGADTEALRSKVKIFVAKEVNHQSWFRLWSALRLPDGDNKEIDELGHRWLKLMLRTRPNTHTWHQVWSTLWESGFERANLISMATQWVQRVTPDDTTWHNVWCVIHAAQPTNPVIIKAGKNWINHVKPRHQGWYRVWQPLFMQNKHDLELQNTALSWFENAPMNHSSWSDCWLELYQDDEVKVDRESLEFIALTWLAQTTAIQKSQAWPTVWRLIWDRGKNHDRLFTVGIEWLKVTPTSAAWHQVFDPLWQSGKAREELEEFVNNRKP